MPSHPAHLTRSFRVLMDLPKIRTVVPDPSDPDGNRLVLLRVVNEGMTAVIVHGRPVMKMQVSRPPS